MPPFPRPNPRFGKGAEPQGDVPESFSVPTPLFDATEASRPTAFTVVPADPTSYVLDPGAPPRPGAVTARPPVSDVPPVRDVPAATPVRSRSRLRLPLLLCCAAVLIGLVAVLVSVLPGALSGTRDGVSAGGDSVERDPIWGGYPGSAYVDVTATLDGLGYEQFAAQSGAMLDELRAALTAEFGFEWVEREAESTMLDSNGYGGESMLHTYDAPVWQTTSTVRTAEEKSRVVEIIRQVSLQYGLANLRLENAPSSWREPGELTERYGGETIETQALWSLSTFGAFTPGGYLRADIVDLSLDTTGSVTSSRQFDVDHRGTAAEGIELRLEAFGLLKQEDRAAYLDALKPYEGLDKPE